MDDRRPLWVVGFVIFVAFLDLFIQFPVVAPFARSLGAAPAMIGIIVGAYSATNLVGNLLSGVLLDRWGRRLPVLWGLVVSGVALLGYALANTPELLLLTRAAHGLATSTLTPGTFAILGDTAGPSRRARVMGVNGSLIGIAAVMGPPLAGGMRDRLGFGAVFILGGVLMLVAAVLFWRFVHETVDTDRTSERHTTPSQPEYMALWTRPTLLASYMTALALTVGLGMLVTHLPLALTARGEPAARTGLAFTAYAVVALLVLAGPLNRLSDRLGRHLPMATGLALIGIAMLILAVAPGLIVFVVGMAIFGLGFGLLFPAATALITDVTAVRERGAAFGIFYAVYSGGVVIGSVVSGLLNGWQGDLTGLPFLVGALVALAFAPTIAMLGRRNAQATKVVTTGL